MPECIRVYARHHVYLGIYIDYVKVFIASRHIFFNFRTQVSHFAECNNLFYGIPFYFVLRNVELGHTRSLCEKYLQVFLFLYFLAFLKIRKEQEGKRELETRVVQVESDGSDNRQPRNHD